MGRSSKDSKRQKFNTQNMERFVREAKGRNILDRFRNSVKMMASSDAPEKQHLYIKDPAVLAAFFAYCSGPSPDKQVYLRGCTRNYPNALPSLFRPGRGSKTLSTDEYNTRWKAYQRVLKNVRAKLTENGDESRWKRANLGAILQHYGVNTPWLDVIRNLNTAIWFAARKFKEGNPNCYELRPGGHGWISFYRRIRDQNTYDLKLVDLSGEHSSTFVRAHAQHGMSFAMQDDNVEAPVPWEGQDFNYYRIANVCFPLTCRWISCGHLSSTAFMFPPKELDSSLKRLVDCGVDDILRNVCCEFELPCKTLGSLAQY